MAARITSRDVEVMQAIGRFRMLTRSQMKRWFFPAVSEPVVSRFVERLVQHGLIGAERLHGNGIQVVWLTKAGAELLTRKGVASADLFPASGPAAAKDFAHTVAIVDAAVWLSTRAPRPDEVIPAWRLARLFGGRLSVVPDLLALWRAVPGGEAHHVEDDADDDDAPLEVGGHHGGAGLAVEIDLGTEPLTVLLPKLQVLTEIFARWMFGGDVAILVLVSSVRRRDSLCRAAAENGLVVLVDLLPLAESANSRR